VSSGPMASAVASIAKAALHVAARPPTPLGAATPGAGTLASHADSALFSFSPADAMPRFVELHVSSPDTGGAPGIAIPASGKQADALGAFGVRFGLATKSTDVTYVVVTDGSDETAAQPPYAFALSVVETPCTAFSASGVHTSGASAFALTSLPA